MKALLKEFFSNRRRVAITAFAIFYPILATLVFVILDVFLKISIPDKSFYLQLLVVLVPPIVAFFYLPIQNKIHLFIMCSFLSIVYLVVQIPLNLIARWILSCLIKGGYCEVP